MLNRITEFRGRVRQDKSGDENRASNSMKERDNRGEAKEGSHASYKFSFCCFFCRRADIERERGGDKLHKQHARSFVIYTVQVGGANKREMIEN